MEDDDDAAEETRQLLGVLDAFDTHVADDEAAVAAVGDAAGLSALIVARLDAVAGEGAEEKKQFLKTLRYLLDMEDKALTELVPKMEEGARVLLPSLLNEIGAQTGPGGAGQHAGEGMAAGMQAAASNNQQQSTLLPPEPGADGEALSPAPPSIEPPPQLPVRARVEGILSSFL